MGHPQYRGEQLSQAQLLRRRRDVEDRHGRALSKVAELVSTQEQVSADLGREMGNLKLHGDALDRMRSAEEETGLVALLTRRFSARRNALSRRSVAEALLQQYESVSVRLREATAFADELRLVSLELQDELDQLHQDIIDAAHNKRTAAERVLSLEKQLNDQESRNDLGHQEAQRSLDRLQFEFRTESINLELFQATIEHCGFHLEPSRALRDTVLKLLEEMSTYVLAATHTVNSAGRRIQGLGMLADAPTVVSELQESLDALNEAMEATQDYVARSQEMLAEVLPELSARLKAEAEADQIDITHRLDRVNRDHTRSLAERALREEAEAEVEQWLNS